MKTNPRSTTRSLVLAALFLALASRRAAPMRRAQMEKTGFGLRIRLPAGICEKYSRCLWLCQDTAKSLQFNQKAANFHEYFPACVHFA